MPEWYMTGIKEIMYKLRVEKEGLDETEAENRLERYGPNRIEEKKKATALSLFLNQFKSILIAILLIATVVSLLLGEILDGIVIFVIVIINAILGFLQERKAEKALESLKKMSAPIAKVLRKNERRTISASELVPGDRIFLEVGDRVPADCRLIEEMNLKTNESVLTGESVPVRKNTKTILNQAPVPERYNMVFSGTSIIYGHCEALVVDTGMQTEFGKIASMLQEKEEKTPLQEKLDGFGRQLGTILITICGIIFFMGMWGGAELVEMFLIAVSLAVAAVPEALPAVVAITLAIGVQKMAKHNSIIRRLPAVETLGCATVICSDKTGTLTTGKMNVRKIYLNGKVINVDKGFSFNRKSIKVDRDLRLLLQAGLLCNDAIVEKEVIGDPTEAALIVSARKAGLEDLRKKYKRISEIPFDSERKMMSVAYENRVYTKGGVESVLSRCSSIYKNGRIKKLSNEDKKEIIDTNHKFAANALRVLAFAYKPLKEKISENNLIFIGLQGMIDTPRPEVKKSINKCKQAGIRVIMMTGDHIDTAVSVAKELGIGDNALTGEEIDKINNEQFLSVIDSVSVYARVSPEHKVKITEALRQKNHIVAMTGDGINDAPALKKADIGVAMGISGTEVSKEASDMILADDNFSSIVSAIEEGRGIYDNIKKFILFMLSCNSGEVLSIFITMMISLLLWPEIIFLLLPVQILWMNLLTDGLVAIALSFEPPEPNIMQRKPRNPKEKILTKKSLLYIVFVGSIMAVGSIFLFFSELDSGIEKARTIAFTTLVVFQIFIGLGTRSRLPIRKIGFFSNKRLLLAITSSIILLLVIIYVPFFNPMFKTVPLAAMDWIKIVAVSSTIFFILEAKKMLTHK